MMAKEGESRMISLREIYSIICRVESLPPGEWQRCGQPPNDYPGWRMTFKGREFGADWLGRIDLYTLAEDPLELADAVVRLKEMEVEKVVGMLPTMAGRRKSFRRVPLGTPGSEEIEVTDGYVRLDPVPDFDPKGTVLRWETFPCEERDRRILRPEILWSKEIWGRTRAGRVHTTGTLLVEA